MDIVVLGGGHGAHTMAADLSLKGHNVRLYEMPRFREHIASLVEDRRIKLRRDEREDVASLSMVTTNIEEALQGVAWVFVVVPAFAHRSFAELLVHRLSSDQGVVIFPGTFGSLEFVNVFMDHGAKERIVVAETDTLPWACRLTGSGEVRVFHTLERLGIGVYPSCMTEQFLDALREIYPLVPHPNVLMCGLNSLNPVLHTASVLLNAGRIEYSRGEFYLYEEGITPSVARVVEALDEERRSIGEAFGFKLVSVADNLYQEGYGPKGTLWQTIKGSYLTPIKGPSSLQNRYLTEDTPYGLVSWSQIADIACVDTPVIDSLITLISKIAGHNYWIEGRTLDRLGIAGLTKEELLRKVEG